MCLSMVYLSCHLNVTTCLFSFDVLLFFLLNYLFWFGLFCFVVCYGVVSKEESKQP